MKEAIPGRELRITSDGSHTFYVPSLDEHFHSVHGALNESMHVFIRHGYDQVYPFQASLHICEIGFGTGLNALLTLKRSMETGCRVHYQGIEPHPLTREELAQLNTATLLGGGSFTQAFSRMHGALPGQVVEIIPGFTFELIRQPIQQVKLPHGAFHLVYFDAFGPQAQPELWDESIFGPVYQAMTSQGVLTTYSAKGSVKRALKKCGFQLTHPPGPAGKREITMAVKI